ncbi:MAG: 4Fe-4S binding protein [Spirochaetales bacterium]|nr:4Fe-4S binding protein [Spirochaetales bacterium]
MASIKRGTLIVQVLFAALSNGYLKGFAKGRIYTGNSKFLCTPGMNCYSCPGALFSCPIGSLQATLSARGFLISMYAVGFMVLFGTVLGRAVCGFLCPFGLIQDLLYRIPFRRKIGKLRYEKPLRLLRVLMLTLFVILLPLLAVDITGLGKPWFCKLICPVGTLEAGVPLVLANSMIRGAIGFLYTWKVLLLLLTLLISIVIYRPFCRYLCPLGLVYGLFNRFALYRYEIDSERCTLCGLCQKRCKLDIAVFKNPNSIDCIRCGECITSCPENAIRSTLRRR